MIWQKIKDFGINIYKKRPRSRTLWIGGSVSFMSVLFYLTLLTGMTVETSGDQVCSNECVSYINITSTYWRVCFDSDIELIQTDPGVQVDVYVPTRGKGNWRLFNPSTDCIERKTIYRQLPNRFKIIGHKEATATVKWWSDSLKVPDPVWEGTYDTDVIVNLSSSMDELSFPINYSKVDWSSVINITTGNYTWNMSELGVLPFNVTDWTFNITNENAGSQNISMKIDRDASWYNLSCNNTVIGRNWTRIINNLSSNGGVQINCSMDFFNISQRYVGLQNKIFLEGLMSYWRLDNDTLPNQTIDWQGEDIGAVNGVTINNTICKYDSCGHFDGVNDYINITGSDVSLNLSKGNFTVGMWFNTDGNSDWQTLLSREAGATTQRQIWIAMRDNGRVNYKFSSGGVSDVCSLETSVAYDDGVWHQIIANYNGTDCCLYADNSLFNCDPATAPDSKTRRLLIGRQNNAGFPRYFNGTIDDVMIFNRSLSASEIEVLYNTFDRTQFNYNYEFKKG